MKIFVIKRPYFRYKRALVFIAFYIHLGSCRGRLPRVVGGGGGGLGEGEGDGQEAQDPSPAAAVLGALHRRPPTRA